MPNTKGDMQITCLPCSGKTEEDPPNIDTMTERFLREAMFSCSRCNTPAQTLAALSEHELKCGKPERVLMKTLCHFNS